MPKVTQTLTTGRAQCDIIWHNDDWGQLWKQYLVTTDDVPGIDGVAKQSLDAFSNDQQIAKVRIWNFRGRVKSECIGAQC